MKIVVDANILISSILKPGSNISLILLSGKISFYSPKSILEEFNQNKFKYKDLLQNKTHLQTILKTIEFINDEEIPRKIRKQAYSIVKNIDENDTPYIALALHLDCLIWSGDKVLSHGLSDKGINIIITTSQLKMYFRKLR